MSNALKIAAAMAGAASGGYSGPISYVAMSATYNVSASTCVVSKPTGVVDGDVMLVAVFFNTLSAITPPAGWTLIHSTTGASMTGIMAVYYKVAASEGADYTFTGATPQRNLGVITAWRGVNNTTPIHKDSIVQSTGMAATATSVTTTIDGCMGVFQCFMDQSGSGYTVTPPTDYTEVYVREGATGQPAEVAYAGQSTAGSLAPSAIWSIISSVAGTSLVMLSP